MHIGNLKFIACIVAYSGTVFLGFVLETLGVPTTLVTAPIMTIIALAILGFPVCSATMDEKHYLFGRFSLSEMKAAFWFSSHATILTILLSSGNPGFLPVLAFPIATILGLLIFTLIVTQIFKNPRLFDLIKPARNFSPVRLLIHAIFAFINLAFAAVLSLTIARFALDFVPNITPATALFLVIATAVFLGLWGGMKTQIKAQAALLFLVVICLGAPFSFMLLDPDWSLPSLQLSMRELESADLFTTVLYVSSIAGLIAILPSNLLALPALKRGCRSIRLASWTTLFSLLLFLVAAMALPSLFPAFQKLDMPEFPTIMHQMAVMALFIIAISVLATLLLGAANMLGQNVTNSLSSLEAISRKMLVLRLFLISAGILTWLLARHYADAVHTLMPALQSV